MVKPPNKNIQVLLVDDEVDIIELLSEELEERGHRTEKASSAEQAVEKLAKFRPDVILCDYRMPGKNGLHVLNHLKQNQAQNPSTLFYLVTGQSDLTPEQARELGVHRCIAKPFDISKLIETIEQDV